MRHCDLTSGANRLHASFRTLQLAWQHTAEQWHDATRHEFEAMYLEPMEPEVKAAVDAIRRMDQVLAKAHRECAP